MAFRLASSRPEQRVVRTWNGLSADVVSADFLGVFKRLLGESCSDLFYGVEM